MEKKNYIYETANKVDYDLLKQYADENKLFMTDAEIALWNLLKGNGIGDKFRRQHIVGEYIADFINLKYKLIVEVDGKYHFKGDQPVADEQEEPRSVVSRMKSWLNRQLNMLAQDEV